MEFRAFPRCYPHGATRSASGLDLCRITPGRPMTLVTARNRPTQFSSVRHRRRDRIEDAAEECAFRPIMREMTVPFGCRRQSSIEGSVDLCRGARGRDAGREIVDARKARASAAAVEHRLPQRVISESLGLSQASVSEFLNRVRCHPDHQPNSCGSLARSDRRFRRRRCASRSAAPPRRRGAGHGGSIVWGCAAARWGYFTVCSKTAR